MKFSRIVVLTVFLAFSLNSTIQATWSFTDYKQTLAKLFNTENIKHNIETTFKNKWSYAAAGLFFLPFVCFGAKKWMDKKNDTKTSNMSFESNRYTESSKIAIPTSFLTTEQTDFSIPSLKPEEKGKIQDSSTVRQENQLPQNEQIIPQIPECTDVVETTIQHGEQSPHSHQQVKEEQANQSIQEHNTFANKQDQAHNDYIEIEISDAIIIPTPEEKGQLIMHNLKANTYNIPQGKDDELLEHIVSLMHYFYYLAKKKGQEFKEGTFIIEDVDHKIFNLLIHYVKNSYGSEYLNVESFAPKTCSAYPRPSSHLTNFYICTGNVLENNIKKAAYTHYGIDVYGHERLPIDDKHHILFGRVDENRIFIRMEDQGFHTTDYFFHTLGFFTSVGRKIAPNFFGSDDEPTMRKERVPKDILHTFTTLIREIDPEHADEYSKKAQGLGIAYMYETINQKKTTQEAHDFIKKLEDEYDHLETRIGREVILRKPDFI